MAWIEKYRPPRVGPAETDLLKAHLAPVSDEYLRRLLRETKVPMEPLVEGIRQTDFDELERTLLALANIYEGGERIAARKLVLTAKQHAQFTLGRLASTQAALGPEATGLRIRKEEMLLWMTTWLENPPVFRTWISLRKSKLKHPEQPQSN